MESLLTISHEVGAMRFMRRKAETNPIAGLLRPILFIGLHDCGLLLLYAADSAN